MTPLYFDNSTTARPSDKVISAMLPFLKTFWGTTSTPHQKGQELYSSLTDYYKILYHFIGAKEKDRLVLTSSGSEAVNHVVSSVYRDVIHMTGKNQLITSRLDEAPAMMAINGLETFGCVGRVIEPSTEGRITPEALSDIISPRTALVSVSWANGLTGVIQPIAEIGELCKKRGILFHVDATHVLGKMFFDLDELNINYLTFNGEQLHAPKGSGILYIKEGAPCSPFIFGSADQGGLRAGSLNMAALAGLACAAQEALDSRDLLCTEVARLRNQLEKGIIKGFPNAQICFKDQERLPHVTTIIFKGISNEALLFILNKKGVYASIGGGNFQQLGLILAATGISDILAHSALSFSLSRYTTEEEIDRTISIVIESANLLANLSKHLLSELKQ